jgi:sec-independent protein translocase protein TatC
MYRDITYIEYLYDLRNRVFRITIAVGVVTAICMTFSISMLNFHGYKIPFLEFDPFNNVSIQVIHILKENLLPQNVNLIQLTPLGAFSTQINVAATLGVILVTPIIVRELAGFVGPGLYQHEKAIIKKFTASAIGLFAIGCLFSYFVVVPNVLNFLYKCGQSIGIITFFDIGKFIPFVMQLLIIFGFSYQLPIIMWATTVSGIVEYSFWRHKLKYAVIIIAIFGAIITPDGGSGVTIWFAAGPMLLLYMLGMLLLEKKGRHTLRKLR